MLRRLHHGNAIVGVTNGLGHASNLRAHAIGNGLTGGVVHGAIDTQAGRQALHGGLHGLLARTQIVHHQQRRDVGRKAKHGHDLESKRAGHD